MRIRKLFFVLLPFIIMATVAAASGALFGTGLFLD